MTTTLTEAIRASDLTKIECAKAAGVSRSQLYMYETGKLRPELKNALRIAEALGVSVGEVAEFEPALEEAEAQRVELLMDEVQEQILRDGREVHIAVGELPGWLRNDLGRYAEKNPGSVRHLTLNFTLGEMQALASRERAGPVSKYGKGK